MALLAVDLGTTGVRALILDLNGRQLAQEEYEVPIVPRPGNIAEQRVESFWIGMVTVVKRALDRAGITADAIDAVGFSHQRCTFALVDANNNPLTEFIVWMDQRGLPQLDAVHERVGLSSYYDITGLPIYYISSLSKILWLRDHQPEAYKPARSIWPISNFLLTRMGVDDPPIDHATASFYGLFDTRSRQWSEALVSNLELDLAKLPRVVSPGTVVGRLTNSDAASQLGLNLGTPLVIGGGDQQCAALGSGMISPGQSLLNIGTATAVMASVSGPARDPSCVIPSVCHTVPGQWEMEGHTQASGVILQRFRDEFGSAEAAVARGLRTDAYSLLAEQASQGRAAAGGLTFLPTFNGTTAPINYAYSSGTLLGLRLSHTRSDVLRAMLEGMCLENRWILDHMESSGAVIETVHIAGGGSRSPFWNQLHADILQRRIIRVGTSNAAAVGAGICAGIGVGLFRNAAEGVEALCTLAETYTPDTRVADIYEQAYELYRMSYQTLKDSGVFLKLHEFGTRLSEFTL
jgi:xylulokinase